MGITIHQSPTGYTSAHEEVWHVVESTDKNITGFQYVYDIYKEAELLTRVKNSPLGADKLGVLDVGNIVRSALDNYNFPQITISGTSLQQVTLGSDIFFTTYDIQYGQVSGVGEVSGNLASGTYTVYNNYKRAKWDKLTSEIVNGRFLTNRPKIYWYENEPVIVTAFQNMTIALDPNRIRYYKENNVLQFSGTINAYPRVIGILPVAGSDKIELTTDTNDVLDTLYFEKKCSKYETHTLIFLNAFGVYDSFTFVHGKLMMSNEKKKFEQTRWGLSGNSMVEKSGAVYNESMKTYAVKYKEKMMLTSDILSTGEYNWLSELINSPQVYYYSTENSEYYPVQITDTDYEFKDDRINKTDTLSVTIEFSTPQNTQYR